uniref:Notecarin-D2 n=1 Tax=Melanaphis sacchari TaxID=742174 RepID=A0A2H8TX70_9HEMI
MCPPMESDSLDFECIFEDKYISCLKAVPGTILNQTCKATHRLSNEQEQRSTRLICLEDATWSDDDLYTCIPFCGQLYTPSNKSSDEKIEYETVPWSVGLYRQNNSHHDEYFELICGGTLIAPNLVVTAAQCYWEEGNTDKILTNKNNTYKVAVGKYTSDISIKENNFTQIIDVGLIYLKESYNGSSWYYADDLAIIVLYTQVTISDFVLPICIDWSKQYTVPNGSNGKVVGWGKTKMIETSSILLKANVSYIDKNTCRDMYTNGFQSLVTVDKFCAVSPSEQNINEIFIGSSLTYEHGTLQFLTGIVSVMNPSTNDLFAVFTDVSHHIQWIHRFVKDFTNVSEYIVL